MAWAVKCPLGVSKAPLRVMRVPSNVSNAALAPMVSFNGLRDTARQYGDLVDCARTRRALSAGRIPLSGQKDTRFRG